MSLISVAKDAVTNLATTDVIKERLALALDFADVTEKKNADLEKQIGVLEFQLKGCQMELAKKASELETLTKQHEEQVQIHCGVELRRGKRTGNIWQPFCPVCQAPIVKRNLTMTGPPRLACSAGECEWRTDMMPNELLLFIDKLA